MRGLVRLECEPIARRSGIDWPDDVNLIAADLVTAKGEVVQTNEFETPELL